MESSADAVSPQFFSRLPASAGACGFNPAIKLTRYAFSCWVPKYINESLGDDTQSSTIVAAALSIGGVIGVIVTGFIFLVVILVSALVLIPLWKPIPAAAERKR